MIFLAFLHFRALLHVVAHFDKWYLGTRRSFFNSVKSICFPIIQILIYVQMGKFNIFWPEPPTPFIHILLHGLLVHMICFTLSLAHLQYFLRSRKCMVCTHNPCNIKGWGIVTEVHKCRNRTLMFKNLWHFL